MRGPCFETAADRRYDWSQESDRDEIAEILRETAFALAGRLLAAESSDERLRLRGQLERTYSRLVVCDMAAQRSLAGLYEDPASHGRTSCQAFDAEHYDRSQRMSERDEAVAAAGYRRHLIEHGDPECEQVLEALEAGWRQS